MIVKKIEPIELPADCVFYLKYVYHAELSEFIAITDRKWKILFVNKKVPEKDIDGFLEVINFPYYLVNDDEAPTGQFLDYVYHEYGFHTYKALFDAHAWKMDQKEKKQAEEAAKLIIPLIEKETNSKEPVVDYNEYLINEIQRAGIRLNKRHLEAIYLMTVYMYFILATSWEPEC